MHMMRITTLLNGAALCAALGLAGCATPGADTPAPGAAGAAQPAAKTYVWSRSMEAKRVALDKAVSGTGISVLRTKDNQLQVNVPSDFSFDTDSAAIKPGMRPVLDQFAQDLHLPLMARTVVLVVGHTDSRGSDAVNDALSLARANSVSKYLQGKGVAAGRIAVEGRGERQPLVDSTRDYALALNRRVEMYLRESAD
jgi:outer membrane protein OmpA-like peptidoglycan-associated protein